MHLPRFAGRLVAAGLLTLIVATTAAAELSKQDCYDARVKLGGYVYWRIADCFTQDDQIGCQYKVRSYHATWSQALADLGCVPWPSEENLWRNALGAVLTPPDDF